MEVGAHLRNLGQDLVKYGSALALTQIAGLVLVPLLTRVLSVDEYGAVDVIALMTVATEAVLRMAIPAGLARFYASTPADALPRLVSSLLGLVAAVGALTVAAIVPLLSSISVLLFDDSRYHAVLWLACCIGWLQAMCAIAEIVLRMERRILVFAALRGTYSLLYVAFAVQLVLVRGAGIAGVFQAQILASVVLLLGMLFAIRRQLTLRPPGDQVLRLARYSLPLVPGVLLSVLLPQISRIVLVWSSGLTQVAIYGVAARLAQMASVPGLVFQRAWQPYAMLVVDAPARNDLYRVGMSYFSALLAGASLVLTGLAPEILSLLAPPEYQSALPAVPWVIGGVAVSQTMMFTRLGLLAAERTGTLTLILALAAAVNLVAAVLLVELWQALGAALATFLGAVLRTTLLGWCSHRVSEVRFESRRLFAVLLLFIASATAILIAGSGQTVIDDRVARAVITTAGVALILLCIDRREALRHFRSARSSRSAVDESES